eukprot:s3386_g7.t1
MHFEDWELVSDEVDSHTFVAPVPKASAALPAPRPKWYPRCPALLQVDDSMSSVQTSSRTYGPVPSQTGCRFSVTDLTPSVQPLTHSQRLYNRGVPYHVSDLQPSVLPRPVRTGYQPQSLRAVEHSTEPPRIPAVVFRASTSLQTSAVSMSQMFEGSSSFGPCEAPQLKGTTSRSMQLLRLRKPSDSPLLTSQFNALLQLFGDESDVFTALSTSQFAEDHRNRLLDAFAASTVFRYMQAVSQFCKTIQQLGWTMQDLTATQFVDTLTVMSHARSTSSDGMSGNFTIKALRWFRKIAGVRLLDVAFSPLVDSFLKLRLTKDSREAPPLPLWILFQWERKVLQSNSSTFDVIMLGSFLFIAWSGLRFADAQRMNMRSLVLSEDELRGMVWRSKTRSSGHPFGVISSGLCSIGSFTWLVKFLRTLDTFLADHDMEHCDFLIPHLSEEGTLLSPEPMDYAAAMKVFRFMLQTPWKSLKGPHPLAALTLNYTLHSLKATLLSFGPQLGSLVADDDRLQQGHHADPRKSLHLYGRDSVWGSLRYQRIVIEQVRSGFRPKTAQHRGGQLPLAEPPVVLELFKKQATDFTFRWFAFSKPIAVEDAISDDLVEVDESSSSSSSHSSEDEVEKGVAPTAPSASEPASEATCEEVTLAKHRRVTHAMVLDKSDNSIWPVYQGHRMRPACGTRMSSQDTEFLDEWTPDMSFCQHPGCKKAWSSAGMF